SLANARCYILLLLYSLLALAEREQKFRLFVFIPPDNACNNKHLDLVFIIDSSRSVRPYDFEKVKEFILTILHFLYISSDITRVGLIQYGSTVKNEFSLKTFRRKHDVERAVRRMMHLATGTMTGLAIQYAVNIAFSESEGARPLNKNVPRIIMIVTDGRPQDPVAEVAAKARNSGILIFAIGVGRVDMNTLKSIGSEPHEEHVFLVANFSQIETLTTVFQNKLCVPHMCSIAEHGCDHFCINTPGSYVCKCKQGYILNSDQRTCSTQDLCAVEKHACEQICVNTPGSYVCQCYDGYELDEDGKKCIVVDYCVLEHGCQHECVAADDSYYCRCHQGFILNPDKKTCRRPDYCALQDHGCQQECVSTDDSYVCRCRHGFTLNPDKRTCKSKSCKHICRSVDHGCEHACANTDDSYVCKCHEGYILREDGKTCRNKDVCKSVAHGCEHICVNKEDSYICRCRDGFVLREDGKTCRSKDPCKSTEHDCEHICVNNNSSYICKCHEGFMLEENGKTCRCKSPCLNLCTHLSVLLDQSPEISIPFRTKSGVASCTEGPIDLVFVIDGSKSLGEDNFEIVKTFVTGILDSLLISPKAARVGLLQYSTQVRTEFTLRQFSTAKEMKKAVSKMKYMGKGSMTGLALKQMFERSFTQAEGARPFSTRVPRVSIVVTDGRAQDEVSEWANKAKQNGITIYAIGIGKAIEEELLEIASDPPDKNLFYAEDLSTMEEISEKLKTRICEVPGKKLLHVTEDCSMGTLKTYLISFALNCSCLNFNHCRYRP
uniref:Matrilin 2 n=1 Tax=Sphenodon punctatus TaxID=8508 RepID=A0A8D0H2R0_SPHPU